MCSGTHPLCYPHKFPCQMQNNTHMHPFNSPFTFKSNLSLLSSLCCSCTHPPPVIQRYPIPHSTTSALSPPSAVIYVSTSDPPCGTTNISSHGGCQHIMSMNMLTCMFFFQSMQKHFCFHSSCQPVKFPLAVFQQQCICFKTLSDTMNLCQLTADQYLVSI